VFTNLFWSRNLNSSTFRDIAHPNVSYGISKTISFIT